MKLKGTLLVVDDNKSILSAVNMLAESSFASVVTTTRPDDIPSLLRQHHPDVVLLDMNFHTSINTGGEGLFWLGEIKRLSPLTRVVLFTAYADVNLAVEGMKRGATDFVMKPFDNGVMLETLLRAYNINKEKLTPTVGGSQGERAMLRGTSPAMQKLRKIVEKIAATDANILITGENGTGKEMLTREIHRLSTRATAPFVSVDMGAITETLFESELFGHVKGAFTDAKSDRMGKFEVAEGGTLFLDEVGNLSYQLQAKLLTAIQQKLVVRVGSNTPIPVNVRLICATNCNLPQMVSEGTFREDLLYRINTIHLQLPALRERPEDIPAFANMFVEKYGATYGKPDLKLLPDACLALQQQPWRGNIRELEHVIEKAVIMAEGKELGAKDFDYQPASRTDISQSATSSVPRTLEEIERSVIADTLHTFDGNLSLVSQQLGITRQTLYNKLKKYGL